MPNQAVSMNEHPTNHRPSSVSSSSHNCSLVPSVDKLQKVRLQPDGHNTVLKFQGQLQLVVVPDQRRTPRSRQVAKSPKGSKRVVLAHAQSITSSQTFAATRSMKSDAQILSTLYQFPIRQLRDSSSSAKSYSPHMCRQRSFFLASPVMPS